MERVNIKVFLELNHIREDTPINGNTCAILIEKYLAELSEVKEPAQRLTDEQIEKWADKMAFKRWQIHTLSTLDSLKGSLIFTAKAYRDGIIAEWIKNQK